MALVIPREHARAAECWTQAAAGASLRFGFEHLGLDRILAFALPENTASRRVMEKQGMTYYRRARLFGIEVVVYRLDRAAFHPGTEPYLVV